MSMNINEGAFLLIPVILVLQLIAFTNCQAPAIVILIYLLLNGLSVFFVVLCGSNVYTTAHVTCQAMCLFDLTVRI